jgi:hypothetical protein
MRPLRLLVAALILAAAATAWAQRRESVPILGVLRTSSFVANDPSTEALKRALREHGYVEGQSVKIVRRFAEGQLDRLPQLAQDLVELQVDVILAPNHAAVRAAKQATTTIPIVMVLYDYDPVASGLIQSLSRPGGNVTGIFSLQPELGGKRLLAVLQLGDVARDRDGVAVRQRNEAEIEMLVRGAPLEIAAARLGDEVKSRAGEILGLLARAEIAAPGLITQDVLQ